MLKFGRTCQNLGATPCCFLLCICEKTTASNSSMFGYCTLHGASQWHSMPEMTMCIGRRLDRPLLRAELPQPRMTKHPRLSCVCILTSDPDPGLPPHCLCNDACVTRNRRLLSLHSHGRAAPVTPAPSLARLPSRESWSCIIPNVRAPTHPADRQLYRYRAHLTYERQSFRRISSESHSLKSLHHSQDE